MKMNNLKWETIKVKVKDLIQFDINPRKISEEKKEKLKRSLEKFNLVEIPAIDTDMTIIGGNQRVLALKLLNKEDELIDVRIPNRKLSKKEIKEYAIISNTHAGEFDLDILNTEFSDLDFNEIGFDIQGLSNIDEDEKEAKEKLDLSDSILSRFVIEIECINECEQEKFYTKLTKEGYKCKILTL